MRRILTKLCIAILVILAFQCIFSKSVHAESDWGGILLEPVSDLFVGIGDATMSLLQKTILGSDVSSTMYIDENGFDWRKVIVVICAVVAGVVTVASAVLSGGLTLALVIGTAGALLKIGLTAVIIYFSLNYIGIGENDAFSIPMFELTPERIFSNELLPFDVNFFNPKDDVINNNINWAEKDTIANNLSSTMTATNIAENIFQRYSSDFSSDEITINSTGEQNIYNGYQYFDENGNLKENADSSTRNIYMTKEDASVHFRNYKVVITLYRVYTNGYTSKEQAGFNPSIHYKEYQSDSTFYYSHYEGKVYEKNSKKVKIQSSAMALRNVISAWYKVLRVFAVALMLSILVYVGIRIVLSSSNDSKAKYKQMLINWLVAMCLLFFMHFIMAFAVEINEKIIEIVKTFSINTYDFNDVIGEKDETKSYGDNTDLNIDDEMKKSYGYQMFIIEGKPAYRAWEKVVGTSYKTIQEAKKANGDNPYVKLFNCSDGTTASVNQSNLSLYIPADDAMTCARLLGQDKYLNEIDDKGTINMSSKDKNSEKATASTRVGYNIIYVVLVVYTVIFSMIYFKRVIYMAFLTIIAPFVAMTYPLDKMGDGKAQAFDMWLKEYIFNLLLQPVHLMLYTILIGSAMNFASTNLMYVVVALGFMVPAEKLIRNFFGFGKASTPGVFGGAAGAAIMMSGINRLMHKAPPKFDKGSNGANKKFGDSSDNDNFNNMSFYDTDVSPFEQLGTAGGPAGGTAGGTAGGPTGVPTGGPDGGPAGEPTGGPAGGPAGVPTGGPAGGAAGGSAGGPAGGPAGGTAGGTAGGPAGVPAGGPTGVPARRTMGSYAVHIGPSPTNKMLARMKRRKKIKKFKRGVSAYLRNSGQRRANYWERKFDENGGGVNGAIRLATKSVAKTGAGLASGVTFAGAGLIAGITQGDIGKGVSYIAAGATGGYKAGSNYMGSVLDKAMENNSENMQAFKEEYHYDDIKQEQKKKWEKEFKNNEDNIKKVEKAYKVERSKAKEILNNRLVDIASRNEVKKNLESAIAVDRMVNNPGSNISMDEALSYSKIHNDFLDGKKFKNLTKKSQDEYRDTFKNNFVKSGSQNADRDADDLINNIQLFQKYRKIE